jgi:hypothetical protein
MLIVIRDTMHDTCLILFVKLTTDLPLLCVMSTSETLPQLRKARRTRLRSHSTYRHRRNEGSQAGIRRQEPSRRTATTSNTTRPLR